MGQMLKLITLRICRTHKKLNRIEEPYVKATMMAPNDYVVRLWNFAKRNAGIFIDMQYLDETRVTIVYEIPLSEIVYDFFDQLKSNTKGYAPLIMN